MTKVSRKGETLDVLLIIRYSQIDFNALDKFILKPIGVYGSIAAIIDFLSNAQCIDEDTHVFIIVVFRRFLTIVSAARTFSVNDSIKKV